MLARFMFTRTTALSATPYHWLFRTPKHAFSTQFLPSQVLLTPKKSINVRLMTKTDLQLVMKWAAQEGWNPVKYGVDALYAADPRGYHLLEVDGEAVASLASVRHAHNFAFLGLYIVKPEFRSFGYGKLLWDVVMGTLQNCGTVGLNGVLNQTDNYAKAGFKPAWSTTRWQGVSHHHCTESWSSNTDIKLTNNFSRTQVIDYDASLFSVPRVAFLNQWLTQPGSHVLAAIDNGVLRGYGVVCVSEKGYNIAPLFADNAEIAEKIYAALCRCIGDHKIIQFDVQNNNPAATALAKRFKLEKTFDTMRMYRGPHPGTVDEKTFGLTSLEIG